jgi:carbamoyl-phosphate synthase large subunit
MPPCLFFTELMKEIQMKSTCNILFTSSGRRVALLQHFKRTLELLNVEGSVITTDLKKHAPTAFVSDRHVLVPRVSAPDYIATLLDICRKYSISLLIPLIDTELLLLSENSHLFAAMGVKVLVCSPEANRICRNKNDTAGFFAANGFGTAEVLSVEQIFSAEQTQYPYLIKPFDGSCSIGVTKVQSREELVFFSKYVKNPLLQEYIEGEEYTVDVLVDFAGKVRCVVPRLRMETRAGEVSKGMTVKDAAIIETTKAVAETLPGALGCLTIQCFKTKDGQLKYIEINPRFGGGFPLSIAAGADFPKWIIEMLLGRQPEIALDGWQDGTVMLRYDEAIFTTRDAIQ